MTNKRTFRLQSFVYAVRGLRWLVASQPNALVHLAVSMAVVCAAIACNLSRIELVLVSIIIGLVWITEAINTAIEALCDVVSPQHHPLVERAKDVAAGAVLIASLTAVAVGIAIFYPVLAQWLGWE